MKRFSVLWVLAALLACGPSKVSSDGGTTPLTEEEADASVPLPESDGGEVVPEADAGVDAGVIDAGCVQYPAVDTTTQGPVSVTVYDGYGRLDLTAVVVHHHADGSVASSSQVNSNGQATFTVKGGDSISVARKYLYSQEVFTWMAVQPGDQLVAGVSQKPVGLSPWGMAQLIYPGSVPGAAGYRASVGCETSYTAASTTFPNPLLFLDKPCNGAVGNFVPMLGGAYDSSGRLLAYVSTPNQSLTVSSSQGYTGTFRPTTWKTDFVTVTATALNTSAIERLEASAELLTPGNEKFPLAPIVGSLPGSHEVRVPRGLGVAYQHLFAVNVLDRVRGTRRVNVLKASTPPTEWGGPVESFFLPEVLDSSALPVAEDTARRDIEWSTAACMKSVHGLLATTRWFVGTEEFRWTLVGPPTHGPLRTPQLPDELAQYRPPPDATLTPSVAFFLSSKLTGWNDMRARFTELPKVREERLLDRTLFPGVEHELRFSILF